MPPRALEKGSSRQTCMIDSEISKSFVSCHINPEIDASKSSRKIADPKSSRSGP